MTIPAVFTKLMTSIAVILAAGLLCLLIVNFLRRTLRIKKDRSHTLRIKNEGNIPSIYYINIESPEPALKFQLFINQIPLVSAPIAQPQHPATAVAAAATGPQYSSAQKVPSQINTSGALKAGRAASSGLGIVASLMGTLGNLLPGQLGSSLRSNSAAAREAQLNTTRAVQAPVSVQRDVAGLQRQGAMLADKTQGKPSATGSTRQQGTTTAAHDHNSYSRQSSGEVAPEVVVHPVRAGYSARTPEIQPGASQVLTLNIGTKKWQYPEGSFLYTVWSEQVPVEPLNVDIPAVRKDGTVHFENISGWRYWLSPLASALVISIASLFIIFSLIFIW